MDRNDMVVRCEEADGLYLPEIKSHSLRKIELHNRYAAIFSTAMKNLWSQRAYIGLYSGAGRARIEGTKETIETSALAVLRQPDPFTHYIYVDRDQQCTDALTARVAAMRTSATVQVIQVDVDNGMRAVIEALPTYGPSKGLLSFCFVDPFDLRPRFSAIKSLSHLRIDFLVLLMLGIDARRNFRAYFRSQSSTRVADFIDYPDWRAEYRDTSNGHPVRYLIKKYDEAMVKRGFLSAKNHLYTVNIDGMGVMLYKLAFYTKHEAGMHLWKKCLASVEGQLNLL